MSRLQFLLPRQRQFAEEFVRAGGNGSVAAKAAGYAHRSAAARLLHDDTVLALILAAIERGGAGADMALASLARVHRSPAIARRLALLKQSAARPRIVGASVLVDGDAAVRAQLLRHSGCTPRLHDAAGNAATADKSNISAASEAPPSAKANGSTARAPSILTPEPKESDR